MNPIRRELLNGLFVLVLASLISAAFAAFQVTFNIQLWVLILIGVGIAVTGYVVFEIALGYMASAENREKEWLRRIGTPARLEMNTENERTGLAALGEAIKAMTPDSDYTALYYVGPEGGGEITAVSASPTLRETVYGTLLERVRQGKVREYKRILCFDHDVLANDRELVSGMLRVGTGPGTIDRVIGEHCRLMMETKGCSLFVAPAVLRAIVVFFGTDKLSITVETSASDTGGRRTAGVIFFSDPPNGEIIEQFRQLERATERRMVAVHKIRFPEDEVATTESAAR